MQPVFFIEVPDGAPEKGDESDAISGECLDMLSKVATIPSNFSDG